MTDRYVELRWTCRECGAKDLLGREKRCPTCGSPRETGEMKMDGLETGASGFHEGASVTDAEGLALAEAGADWFCAFCGTGNRNDHDRCAACGSERVEGKRPVAEVSSVAPSSRRWVPWVGAVLVGLVLLCGLGLWLAAPVDVGGRVSALRWTQTTVVQGWQEVRREDWRSDLAPRAEVKPVAGQGEVAGVAIDERSCVRKHRRDERYACGTDRVCVPKTRSESYACGETCVDQGNGFAKCSPKTCTREVPDGERCHDETRWCSRPIHEPWCAYDTQAWVEVRRETAKGEGIDTSWPEVTLGPLERRMALASYEVEVSYADDGEPRTHVFDPTNLEAKEPSIVERGSAEDREAAVRAWVPAAEVTVELSLGKVREVRLGAPKE